MLGYVVSGPVFHAFHTKDLAVTSVDDIKKVAPYNELLISTYETAKILILRTGYFHFTKKTNGIRYLYASLDSHRDN